MNTDLYIRFIRFAIKTEGYEVADKANKLALASAQITTAQYSRAARLIAKAFLDQSSETEVRV